MKWLIVILILILQSCVTDDIGTVKAYDQNTKQVLAYKIVDGNTGNAFAIDQNTGMIKIVSRQALTGKDKFELIVTVTDDGKLWTGNSYYQDTSLSSKAIITIMPSAWNKK